MGAAPGDRCKIPRGFWRVAEQVGLPPTLILRAARLPATLHLDPHALVTTANYFALWRALEDLSGDPALGLKMVEAADPAMHPPATLVAFYARDYRDGLMRVARFKRLCTPEKLHFCEDAEEFSISAEWLYATAPEPAIATDIALAFLLDLGRRGTQHRITPRRIDYAHPGPITDAHRAFFGCPIICGAPRSTMVLDKRDLRRPFPGHNPELLDILTPALALAVDDLEARVKVSHQVKSVLKHSLASGRPEVSSVARELGMSERTLQRRITQEGTTFRDLLSEARRELGQQLLADPACDIDEVAFMLGYHDASSFYRAFRDWEGQTPAQWRENRPRRQPS
jgi:AraC-like DNA-binding protein